MGNKNLKWKFEFDDYQVRYLVELLTYAVTFHDSLAKGSSEKLGDFSKMTHRNAKAIAEPLRDHIVQITG